MGDDENQSHRPQVVQASDQTRKGDHQGEKQRGIESVPAEQYLETGRVEMIPATSLQHQNKTINYLITKQQENGDNYRKRVVV